jgi:MFS family permease
MVPCDIVLTPRRLKVALVAIVFVTMTSFYSVLPYFPTVAHQSFDMSRPEIGYVIATLPFGYLVASIASAGIRFHAYSISTLRRFYVLTTIVAIGALSLFAVLPRTVQWLNGGSNNAVVLSVTLGLTRLVAGFMFAVGDAVALVVLTRCFPNSGSENVAIFESIGALGAMFGPPIGGVLYRAGGFMLPPLAVAVVALMLCVPVAVFRFEEADTSSETSGLIQGNPVPLPRASQPGSKALSFSQVVAVLRQPFPGAAGATMMGACGLGAYVFLETMAPLHMNERYGVSPLAMGIIFAVCAVTYAGVAFGSGTVLNKQRRRWRPLALAIGAVIMAMGLLVAGLWFPSPASWSLEDRRALVLAGVYISVIGVGVVNIIGQASIVDAALDLDEQMANAGGSVANAVFSLAASVGSIVGSHLDDVFGFDFAAQIFAVVLLSVTFVYVAGCFVWWGWWRRPVAAPEGVDSYAAPASLGPTIGSGESRACSRTLL